MINYRPLLWIFVISCHNLAGQVRIDSTVVFQVGGIKQVVTLKGQDKSKPILLFLHGGPGNSVMHYAEKFSSRLQEHFIVVQWDQREAGKTLALNKSPVPLSVGLFEQDTRALIDTLLKQFNRSKLYLAGHSWGTHLGFYIAKNAPELLYAYIAICPMVNQLESEKIILGLMKEKASTEKNTDAIEELAAVKIPFEDGTQLYFHRKWLLRYMGSNAKITKSQVERWAPTWLKIFNEASKENLQASTPEIRCPIYFFVGRRDYQTNSGITEKYFQTLTAPKKELYWFDRSAHSLPTSEPDKLQEIIINQVLE
jgi:pimeloyl-ACP methyl ester carboxylesterase